MTHAAPDPTNRATTQSPPARATPATRATRVGVLGLGPMGAALARSFATSGVPTTVWNRSAERAGPLEEVGAQVAASPQALAEAVDLLVVCVLDHTAVREVLEAVDDEVLRATTVVNLSTAGPAEARETAAWAQRRGLRYLNGAIMVPTAVIGTPDAQVLYSGSEDVFAASVETLRWAAPAAEHVGTDPGLASLLDTSMLEIFFAALTSFLHATALVGTGGISPERFLPYAARVVGLLPATFEGLAADVAAGRYPGTDDRLAMELAGMEHMVRATRAAGLDERLPQLLHDVVADAVRAGHGDDGFSRVVEVLRGDIDGASSAA